MKITEDILDYILSLDRQTFNKYLIIALSSIFVVLSAMTYFIYTKSNTFTKQIKDIHRLSKEAKETANDYKKIQIKKNHLLSLLDQEKEFDMKSFFENFYKQQSITPDPKWDTLSSSIIGNEQIKEISLPLKLKDFSTQKLIEVLEALNKKEIVYVKELKIQRDKDKTVAIDLTLGALARVQS